MNQLFANIANRKVDEEHLMMNPFPGLRPFQIEESHLFFGREGQTDEVLMKLSENRFVAIIGPSGSGKSSFVYCGVLPTLYGGFLAHKGADWQVVVTRPGAAPVENLTDSLLETQPDYVEASEENKKIRYNITKSLLKSSSLGLVEAIQQMKDVGEKNYLILVDQFEELFRFRKVDETGQNINESLAFVNLLMEAVQNAHVSVYVAITMRSDFIGDCAEYPELTKEINDSHYLIPQMTRDQKRMAIMGPVAVGGGQITPRLVQQLLNDLGEKSDQLPILQHALMRTWGYWREHREGQEPIDIHHYEAIGTMSEALSRHANEAYEELSFEHRKICEIMFKALTETRGEGDGIRRPTKLREIAALAGVDDSEVISVVEKFREPGRSLLTPPAHIALSPETYLDISHESLMRIWERLKIWAEEEGESVRMYLRLAEASEMFQLGKAGLWRPPDLQLALNWQQKYDPSLTWAQRYHPAFERAMVFLEYSNKEWETELKQKELQQKRALKRARITALILGSAAVVSIGVMIFAFAQMTIANRETKRATEQQKLAETNAQKADSAAHVADTQKAIALVQKQSADSAKGVAVEQANIATVQRSRAEQNAVLAQQNADSARQAQKLAEEQKALAQLNEKKATISAAEAMRLRVVSIAKQMAIKSLPLADQNPELEGLLAQQAYDFNSANKGYRYDNDIYNGMYLAIKKLTGPSYNLLKGHNGSVKDIVVSKNDEMYSAGAGGYILQWNLHNQNPIPDTVFYNNFVNLSIALNESGNQLAVAGNSRIIELFNTRNIHAKPEIVNVPLTDITILQYNALHDELIFAGTSSDNSKGNIYAYKNGQVTEIEKGSMTVTDFAADPVKNELLVAYENGEVGIINMDNNKKNIFHKFSPGNSCKVAFSKDGKRLAVADNISYTISIWNTDDLSNATINFTGHTSMIWDLQFSNSGNQLASGSYDKSVRLWDIQNPGQPPIVLQDHKDKVSCVAFSSDDKYVFAGDLDSKENLKRWPTEASLFDGVICGLVKRNLTQKEWNLYVAEDIPYQKTCPALGK